MKAGTRQWINGTGCEGWWKGWARVKSRLSMHVLSWSVHVGRARVEVGHARVEVGRARVEVGPRACVEVDSSPSFPSSHNSKTLTSTLPALPGPLSC